MNKKGFTMIELLAAITILGILTGVAIVAVSWILDLNEERYYSTLEKNVILAAQSYYADHRAALPQAIGQSREITLKTLVERKYLPEVLDYRKGDCTKASGSYVKVTKYSKKDYLYAAYFECPDYETKEEDKIKDISISISFTFDEKKIEDAVSNIKISSTEENKIASYEYGIYKDGQNVYNSDNIPAGYVDSTSRKIKLEKYVPGNIRVVVTAYDIYGNRKTEEKEASIYNNFVPECGSFSPKYTDWTNSFNAKRKVTIQCVDTEIECLRRKFSETFTTDMKTGYISILGKNNKEKKCPVGVYIDKTDPECGTNTGSTNWTTSDRTVKVDCIDGTSGCKKDYYEKTYTTSTITSNIEIGDKAGNTKSCPVDVYVDKTPPRCGIVTGAGTSWTNQNRTITVQCVDGESGCKQESYTKVVTENTKTTTITIEDNVGHKTNCEVNAYVDKTPPSCVSTGGNPNWTNQNMTLYGTCSDAGGSGCRENRISKTYTANVNSVKETPGDVYDNAGNLTTCPANQTVRIDKTAPTCSWADGTKISGNATSFTVSDGGGSGLSKYEIRDAAVSVNGNGPTGVSYTPPPDCGQKNIEVNVFDVAGNVTDCTMNFIPGNLINQAGIYFYDLNSAFAGTGSGGTITTKCDYTDSTLAELGGSKTIDLFVKHTLIKNSTAAATVYDPGILVKKDAKLKIKGTGKLTTSEGHRLVLAKGALVVNMEGGKIVKDINSVGGGACLKTEGSGSVNFKNGILKCDREGISHTDPGNDGQSITVSGGTIVTRTAQAVVCGYNIPDKTAKIKLSITGGTLCSQALDAVYISEKCKGGISGATLYYATQGQNGVSSSPTSVTIDKTTGMAKVDNCWPLASD